MIKENDFIEVIKSKEDITPEEEWNFRKSFRTMSKADKKRHDSNYIHEKNSLSFSEWFDLITENVKEGKKKFERDSKEIYLSKSHDRKRADLNDPEYRDYIGLPPLEKNEQSWREEKFEEYTGFAYPSLDYLNEDPEEDEEEMLDITEQMLDMTDQIS